VDLIPKPDQVVSAAGNLAHRVVYGGVADLRPMPRTLIDEGPLREVYHYRPAAHVRDQGDPVLLVTPLAAPALCYDLRRGCSLVEHLVGEGRPTYLVEYGDVSFKDRDLGMDRWIREVVPTAVREVSAHAAGRAVHLVGWSLGGTFALLTAAADAGLPIASITVLGSPFDVGPVPLVAPLRPLLDLTDGLGAITRVYQAVGGPPQPLVRWAFQLSSFQKLVTKPLALARNLDDADYLAQIEAVDRFTSAMVAYPGRTFGQLYHRLLKGNALVGGAFDLDDGRALSVTDISVPVLVIAGANDAIAPVAAVKVVMPLLTGSPDARFEIVPGGHLGLLTGRQARTSTWPVTDAWMDQWTDDAAPPAPAAPTRRTPRKTAAKKAGLKKPGPKKPGPTKAGPKKTGPNAGATKAAEGSAEQEPTIGANPARRYGSAGSRALGR
jgi:polyhydroxyalkanoate synthase subunit PhaC